MSTTPLTDADEERLRVAGFYVSDKPRLVLGLLDERDALAAQVAALRDECDGINCHRTEEAEREAVALRAEVERLTKERDEAAGRAERLHLTVVRLRDAIDPDGARMMLSFDAFIAGLPDPVATLKARVGQLETALRTWVYYWTDPRGLADARGIKAKHLTDTALSATPPAPVCRTCKGTRELRSDYGGATEQPCPDCSKPVCSTCGGAKVLGTKDRGYGEEPLPCPDCSKGAAR